MRFRPSQILFPLALMSTVVGCGKDTAEKNNLRRTNSEASSVVVVGAEESAGGWSQEVEPNNDMATATVIPVDTRLKGTLDGSTDIDLYKGTTTAEGMLFLKLDGAPDADLILELLDDSGTVLAHSDRGPATTVEGIAGYWFDAGQHFQIRVTEFTKKRLRKTGGRQGLSQFYRLQASMRSIPETGFEIEPNGDVAGAKEIAIDSAGYGYLGWRSDSDMWRVVMDSDGATADVENVPGTATPKQGLHFTVSAITGVDATLSLLSADGKPILSVKASEGNEVAIRNVIPDVSADFYLVQLNAKRSNPEESYAIRVQRAVLPVGTEGEPNNTVATATVLAEDVGALIQASGELCHNDIDTWRIPATAENRVLELQLQGASDADLDMYVLDQSEAVLGTGTTELVGGSETISAVNVPPGKSVWIRVVPKSVQTPASYKLSLSLVPGIAPPPPPPASLPDAGP